MSSSDSTTSDDELSSSTTESISSDEEFEVFEYQPLDQGKGEIRLLKLDTSTVDDKLISGSLETFSLRNCPPFRALSYK